MEITAETWPIAAKMNFGCTTKGGQPLSSASSSDWAEHLEQVVEVGFTAIDPIDDWLLIGELPADRFAELKKLIESFDLAVPGVSFGRRSLVDKEHGEEHLAMMHRALDRAAELGSTILNIGFMQPLTAEQQQAMWFWHAQGHVDDPALRPLAIERVRELADHAQRNGMEIALEMYEDTYIGTAEDAVAFVKDCDHPAVGINPDVGNLIRLHRAVPDYKEIFEAVLPFANYWHIKNYIRDEDASTGAYFSAPASLEDGWIDYRWVIRRALSLGYRGAFQAEHYGGDWLGVGARNAKYIRSVLRGASRLFPQTSLDVGSEAAS